MAMHACVKSAIVLLGGTLGLFVGCTVVLPVVLLSCVGISHRLVDDVPARKLDPLMERGVASWLAIEHPGASLRRVDLLTRRPTGGLMSWPKYAAWIEFDTPGSRSVRGIVRAAARDRTRIEVWEFVSCADLLTGSVRLDAFSLAALEQIARRVQSGACSIPAHALSPAVGAPG